MWSNPTKNLWRLSACGAASVNICDTLNDNLIAYRDAYNDLEGTFDGCEVNHIGRQSNEEADVLTNIGSQCLPVPPGVFWEEINQ